MNIFFDEHLEIIKILVNTNVDFMLIGGYAVIYHGYRRTTGDMDLWLAPDNENKERFVSALLMAGFGEEDVANIRERDFTKHLVFTIDIEPEKIDFLTLISGVNYVTAKNNAVTGDIDGLKFPVINLNELILSKITSNRPKDKADIDELQKINKKRQ
jgi:predicted nucleotidyltransferase